MAKKEDVSKLSAKVIFERGLLSRNPVLVHAIGLCPLIAVAKSASTALALSVVSAIILIACEALAALVYKKLPKWLRIGVYALTGIIIVIPIQLFMEKFLPSVTVNLGIYIPLLTVNSLVMHRCETFALAVPVKKAFLDAAANSLGYAIALMLTGIIREMLGSSSIFGIYLDFLPLAEGFLMPFCGFIILGFIAAFANWMRSRYKIGEEFDKHPADLAMERARRERALKIEAEKAARAASEAAEASAAENEAPAEAEAEAEAEEEAAWAEAEEQPSESPEKEAQSDEDNQ